MKKGDINTRVLSGFVELLPEDQARFDSIKSSIENIYRANGFNCIETPAIERKEILLAKGGGENEKLIYDVRKEGHEDDLALRFDLTVPFARYVANHYGELSFPFKRYSVAKVWRGERPQKGRFREFYQADIDTVAEGELNIAYDAEIILILTSAVKTLSKKFQLGSFKAKISNRKIWNGLFEGFAVEEKKQKSIMSLIDKKPKISQMDFDSELKNLAQDSKLYDAIHDVFAISYNRKDGLIKNLPVDNKTIRQGIEELEAVMKLLDGISDETRSFEIDLAIIRGLDYYTGTVFETFFDNHPEFGSVASGGRYDNLCANFIEKNIVGVGGSLGLSRMFWLLIGSRAAIYEEKGKRTRLQIIPMGEEFFIRAIAVQMLISNEFGDKISSNVVFSDKSRTKLLEKANKENFDYVIFISDSTNKTITIRDMKTGAEETAECYETAAISKIMFPKDDIK
jgi:histidyl-tRNA synthetase